MNINQDKSQKVRMDGAAVLNADTNQVLLEFLEDGTSSVMRSFQKGERLVLPGLRSDMEIVILAGSLSDREGVYPTGTYMRLPRKLQIPMKAAEDSVLFIKLMDFTVGDELKIIHRTYELPWLPGMVPGLSVQSLHEFEGQHTAMVRWAPNTVFNPHRHWGGEEIVVLEGVFRDEHGHYPQGTWLRSPHLSQHSPYTEKEGATIFVKVGHL